VVEQLIRNQQARGSTPRAGSSDFNGLAILADPFLLLRSINCSHFMRRRTADVFLENISPRSEIAFGVYVGSYEDFQPTHLAGWGDSF
jgi:hypothetical protein